MGELILISGVLMAASIAASLLAGPLRVPSLLLFLAVGVAVGSEGLGFVHFDDYELARDVGVAALALIIFEGGLSTRLADLRPVAGSVIGLSIVATFLTAAIAGIAATWLFGLDLLEGILLGSIIASTDAAAAFALLRGSALRPRLARMLEGEAASNDPFAILLVLALIELITAPGFGALDVAWMLARQVFLGVVLGVVVGALGARILSRLDLPTAGLYPVASLTVAALAFGSADVLGGSGFLAVYLAGLILGSSAIPARRTMTAFHDGLAWVAQLTMFLTLGLLVFPSQVIDEALEGLVLAFVLALVARPLAATVATLFARQTLAERILIGWAGLRGAVPVVLATFPVIAGVPGSVEYFNIVFFAVVVSLVVQGPLIEPLARRLGLTVKPGPQAPSLVEVSVIRELGGDVIEHTIAEGDAAAGVAVRDLGLPRDALVNLIVRDGQALPPRGSTRLEVGDRLHVVARREISGELERLIERWRTGPLGPPPRPPRRPRGSPPVFSVSPPERATITGDPSSPSAVEGVEVVAVLQVRRDLPGILGALADGRYAITSPVVAIGGAGDLTRYVQRRLARATGAERVWLQGVIGALASDFRAAPEPKRAGAADEPGHGASGPDGR